MGGVRDEQGRCRLRKLTRQPESPPAAKEADGWRCPSCTTSQCGQTPHSLSRKPSYWTPLGPPAAVVGPEVHPKRICASRVGGSWLQGGLLVSCWKDDLCSVRGNVRRGWSERPHRALYLCCQAGAGVGLTVPPTHPLPNCT